MAANEDRLLNDLLTRILTDVSNVCAPTSRGAAAARSASLS